MIDIKGFEGLYKLSDNYEVYSVPRPHTSGGIIKPSETKDGYLKVVLCKNGKVKTLRVNRIVYETLIGSIPKGYDVHHKNGNKKDNRPENLCLLSKNEHYKQHKSKPVLQYTKDMQLVAEYPSIRDAAKATNLSFGNISNCCNQIGYYRTIGGYIWRFKYAASVE